MEIHILELSVCEYWHARIVSTLSTTPVFSAVLKQLNSASNFNL